MSILTLPESGPKCGSHQPVQAALRAAKVVFSVVPVATTVSGVQYSAGQWPGQRRAAGNDDSRRAASAGALSNLRPLLSGPKADVGLTGAPV
jgi:hypothetical protein